MKRRLFNLAAAARCTSFDRWPLRRARPAHIDRSPLKIRPVWRPAVTFAGAVTLLLVATGFCIVSKRGARPQYGVAIATPNTHVVAWEAHERGIRLFYYRGQVFGIPLEAHELPLVGFGVSVYTRLQGTDINLYTRWWLIIALLVLLSSLAGHDLYLGIRRLRGAGQLCGHCGYDLRESPDRCPECGMPRPASS